MKDMYQKSIKGVIGSYFEFKELYPFTKHSSKKNRHIFGFGAYLTYLIFLLLILLIFREKIGFGSKFRVGSVYILLESYLDNNQPVK